MNNQKDKIEWTNYTLNPIVGCRNACPFCYARWQARRRMNDCATCGRFDPHPHLDRLDQIPTNPRNPDDKRYIF